MELSALTHTFSIEADHAPVPVGATVTPPSSSTVCVGGGRSTCVAGPIPVPTGTPGITTSWREGSAAHGSFGATVDRA